MEIIKKLAQFLTIRKVNQIEIITETQEPKTKSEKLYKALQDGLISTDEEAIALLYENPESNKEAYSKLKYRLKERMVNTVFFMDIQQYGRTPYEKAYARVAKYDAAANLLYISGQSFLAKKLFESVVKTSIKYDLLYFTTSICRRLKLRYGLYEYDKRKFDYYSDLYETTKAKLFLRDKLYDYFIFTGREVSKNKHLKYTDDIKKIEKEFLVDYTTAIKIDDYYIRIYAYNIKYFIAMIKDDYVEMKAICSEASSYFESKIGFPPQALFGFTQKQGLCHFHEKKFDQAILSFQYCIAIIKTSGSLSWLATHNYLHACYIHKKQYSEAYEIASHILNHKAYKVRNTINHESWFVIEAYTNLLIRLGKIDPRTEDAKPLRKFSLGRFKNEFSVFNKDKKGVNVSINILELIFLILDKETDKVIDKIGALNQYSYRYLKGKENVRHRTMIKLLAKIPANQYHVRIIKGKSKTLVDSFRKNPLVLNEQNIHIEPIPYEDIWEYVLENTSHRT